MELQMKIARLHGVASIAARLRSGKRRSRSFPPHRIARELECSREPAHIRHGRAERLCDHLQRRNIDQASPVSRILESNERKQSVDAVKARFLLITLCDLQDFLPAFRSEGTPNRIGTLGGADVTGVPRCSYSEISVENGDVAEADPGSPPRFFHPGTGYRVARKDPIVVPFSAGLLVDHHNRADKLHLVEFESLAAQNAEAVLGPYLVRFDEWSAGAVGNHDVVQRDSVQKVSADAADVDDAVAVVLKQAHDVAANALTTPVAVGEKQGDAQQQQRHHRNRREEAHPPPTH
jgi:hypothetical protein